MVFRYLLTMLNPKANVKISTIFIKITSIFDKTAPILDKTTSILYLFFGLSTFLSLGRNCYYERCFCSPALQHIMLAPPIVCTHLIRIVDVQNDRKMLDFSELESKLYTIIQKCVTQICIIQDFVLSLHAKSE